MLDNRSGQENTAYQCFLFVVASRVEKLARENSAAVTESLLVKSVLGNVLTNNNYYNVFSPNGYSV